VRFVTKVVIGVLIAMAIVIAVSLVVQAIVRGSNTPTAVMPSASARYAWAVGDHGTILATTDGGAHWVARHSGTTDRLVGITFADTKHGWAVGEDDRTWSGLVIATRDGGAHWLTQCKRKAGFFVAVACSDPSHVWAATADLSNTWSILATSDGGSTWATQVSGPGQEAPSGLVFPDVRHGWAVSLRHLLATSDGGDHWRTQLAANGHQGFTGLDFCDSAHGFLVGQDRQPPWRAHTTAALWSTSDGGATWNELPGPPDEATYLHNVGALDARHLVVSGGTGMWYSNDAGRHWSHCTWTIDGKTSRAWGPMGGFACATSSQGWCWPDILATNNGGASWNQQFTGSQMVNAVTCLRPW
jgi:photosystem II stability/assembly factor-like uncharacterized protein